MHAKKNPTAVKRSRNRQRRRGDRQLNRKLEGAAFAQFAFDVDVASHHGDQIRCDCKAESAAAIEARCGGRRLGERREDALLIGAGNTDAGIANRASKNDRVANSSLASDLDDDLADFRELHRIANQVGKNLSQTERIAHHPGR